MNDPWSGGAEGPACEARVAPNLIPMIDIMFLLLLFLMLGADMGQRQLEDLTLPQARGVKQDSICDSAGTTIVNVYHQVEALCPAFREGGNCNERGHWRIAVSGVDYQTSSLAALLKGRNWGTVMIRADQAALYESVQGVLEACSRAGLYKVEIGAAEREGSGTGTGTGTGKKSAI